MLVFLRLTRAALETDRNIVVTTDHSGEAAGRAVQIDLEISVICRQPAQRI